MSAFDNNVRQSIQRARPRDTVTPFWAPTDKFEPWRSKRIAWLRRDGYYLIYSELDYGGKQFHSKWNFLAHRSDPSQIRQALKSDPRPRCTPPSSGYCLCRTAPLFFSRVVGVAASAHRRDLPPALPRVMVLSCPRWRREIQTVQNN
jgi:hypothetical protein